MTGTGGENELWIRRFHPAPHQELRLVCFPHAGGAAGFYYPLSKALADTADVLAVQYPGRQDRRTEPGIGDLNALADLVFTQLKPWNDRPLALFGHSMGATLAFEVTRRLEQAGTAPVVLFASGRRAPDRYRGESAHLLDDDGLVAEIKRLSGTDSRLLDDDELLRMVLPAIRTDYQAIETYRCQPAPKLTAPVVVLTGDADPKTTLDEARAWREHTTGAFDLRVFSGGHFFLNDHQPEITELVTDHLLAARSL